MNPRHPVYIVSKSRWESRMTSKAMERMNVPYHIVVERHEYDEYANVITPSKILVLPQSYLDEYDTYDDLGDTKSKGPGAARNFCMDHSISIGASKHWVMDDNIDAFHRLNKNLKIVVESGTILRCAEDFVDRYENVPLAGLNYYSFCKKEDKLPPYTINTRIYSCLLIDNTIKYRWRGRYNEDTDLSLRVLKSGDCTIQFNAFLQGKTTTQRMGGGNTSEFYNLEGTLNKSKMLTEMHPDVSDVVWKFNRWHHTVDYRPFKSNKLIKKAGVVIPSGVDNYGMILVDGVNGGGG
jgi:hypothetical protein